jgi:hypothetical protein
MPFSWIPLQHAGPRHWQWPLHPLLSHFTCITCFTNLQEEQEEGGGSAGGSFGCSGQAAHESVRTFCLSRPTVAFVDLMASFYELSEDQLGKVLDGLCMEGLLQVRQTLLKNGVKRLTAAVCVRVVRKHHSQSTLLCWSRCACVSTAQGCGQPAGNVGVSVYTRGCVPGGHRGKVWPQCSGQAGTGCWAPTATAAVGIQTHIARLSEVTAADRPCQ